MINKRWANHCCLRGVIFRTKSRGLVEDVHDSGQARPFSNPQLQLAFLRTAFTRSEAEHFGSQRDQSGMIDSLNSHFSAEMKSPDDISIRGNHSDLLNAQSIRRCT